MHPEISIMEIIVVSVGLAGLIILGLWLLHVLFGKSREAAMRYHWSQLETKKPEDMTDEELIEALGRVIERLRRRRL